MDIETYEQQKQANKENSDKPWMNGILRRLGGGKRRDILRQQFDIPLEELEVAEMEVQRTRRQRSQTNNQKKLFSRTEEAMQSAKRKLQRTFHTPAIQQEKRLLKSIPARASLTQTSLVARRRPSLNPSQSKLEAPFPTLPSKPNFQTPQ